MEPRITIKQILLSNQNWWHFYEQHKNQIRPAIVICITKLLSCRNTVRGFSEYTCPNPSCAHTKRIPFTCKCKACSSCGKKATEAWTQKQNQLLPKTSWQHITFTMPSELWNFFWCNRDLLNQIGKIAANCIKTIANARKVMPGIFIAIHTFGRNLKRNVHIHLSTTTGGLTQDLKWKNLFFSQATLMRIWRHQIIKLFRENQQLITIPNTIQKQLNHTFTFNNFLDCLYKKTWIVHCSKISKDYNKIVSYLGRYIKRPAIAESKLKHYDGQCVIFNYLDHNTKIYRKFTLTAFQFIARFIQHIPDIGFRMIRYYGFLAHRVRGKLLPIVYKLVGQEKPVTVPIPTFDKMIKNNFGIDPLVCILCGQQMVLTTISFGKSTNELLQLHKELAIFKKV